MHPVVGGGGGEGGKRSGEAEKWGTRMSRSLMLLYLRDPEEAVVVLDDLQVQQDLPELRAVPEGGGRRIGRDIELQAPISIR